MSNINNLRPALLTGPGDIIKRYLEARGWNQEDLAEITELSLKSISKIINNKQGITVETAKLFARVFENSPDFWLNLDNQYRLALSREEPKEEATRIKAEVRKYMPVLEIQKNGWVEVREKSAEGYLETYKEIWDSGLTPDYSEYEEDKNYCARQGKEDETYTRYYSKTWYKIALNRAKTLRVPKYSKKELIEIKDQYISYTLIDKGVEKIIHDLHEAGVKFLYQKHLSKTYLDGACFFDRENPVIVYTARYDRLDNFWFTLAHEIGHVLNHFDEDRELYILDNLDNDSSLKREEEADRIASEMLNLDEILSLGRPHSKYFTEKNLLDISQKAGVGPAVVLGMLQHYKVVDYRSRLNGYKGKVRQLMEEFGK